MKKLILFTLFVVTACGPQKVKVEVPDSGLISGETYNYVIVKLDFLNEFKYLCEDKHAIIDYPSEGERRAMVANCVFEQLDRFDVNKFLEFKDFVCSNPQTIDEQDICNRLNGN